MRVLSLLMVVFVLCLCCRKQAEEPKVREPAVSGTFYPAEADVLKHQVDKMLDKANGSFEAEVPVKIPAPLPAVRPEVELPVSSSPNKADELVSSEPEVVRRSALAGAWYEGTKDGLAKSVEGFFGKVQGGGVNGYPIALVVPHAGLRWSGQTAAHAYQELRGRSYGRVFVVGPTHRARFHGISLPSVTHYETPLGKIPLDVETINSLAGEEYFRRHPTAHDQEHCIEIQLPFLQSVLGDFKLVPLLVSGLTEEQVGEVASTLRRHIRPGDLLIASSDFTHYGARFGYKGPPGSRFEASEAAERLAELLKTAWAAMERRDVAGFFEHKRATGDSVCGFLPIAVVLSTLPGQVEPHLLQTDTSGNISGDYSESVSYLSAAFTGLWPYNQVDGAAGLTQAEKDDLLKLARFTVDTYVKTGRRVTADEAGITVTERLEQDTGAFVTLKESGHLRGCIGTIVPVKPLVTAVIDNGINAAAFDRRFKPVTEAELAKISIEVSVLTPPVEVAGAEQIVLGKHGVIIEKAGRSAVFLPQVAPEQGWTVEQTLSHLSRKAGLGLDGWREGVRYRLFEALVFHE